MHRAIRLIAIAASLAALYSCGRPEERASFLVPESKATVVVARTPAHAFLAEYDRRALVELHGTSPGHQQLFPDTGGYSRTNLYRLEARKALLRDADASYTIDLSTGRISKDAIRQEANGRFLGSFDADDSHIWRFIPASERGELPTEFRGG
jgi:hypothetical protein